MTRTETRVQDGLSFMDLLLAPGWESRLRQHDLDIETDNDCVLGQCFGSFNGSVRGLGMTPAQAIDLGFFEESGPNRGRRYDSLTRIWKRELAARIEERQLVAA